MAEPLIHDRIKFNKKGVQSKFILDSKRMLGLTWSVFAKKLKINPRTLTDWAREKFHMPFVTAKMISKITKSSIPQKYTLIKWSDHLKIIGKLGGQAMMLKYGNVSHNEEYRKERWRKWWKEVGQYNKNAEGFQSIIKIKIPKENSLLAEFVGIMLGDGGMTQYQANITLSNTEKSYTMFVDKIIKQLFGVTPKISKLKYAKAVRIIVSRKQLVIFCLKTGLVIGDKIKQHIDIPQWIKINQEFSKACVRGLIDTDGCFYSNTYYSNNKKYNYLKIAFTSASGPLRLSVAKILSDLNIKTSTDHKDVRINDVKGVRRYIKIIGSHNQKHLDRIKNFEKCT